MDRNEKNGIHAFFKPAAKKEQAKKENRVPFRVMSAFKASRFTGTFWYWQWRTIGWSYEFQQEDKENIWSGIIWRYFAYSWTKEASKECSADWLKGGTASIIVTVHVGDDDNNAGLDAWPVVKMSTLSAIA